MSDFIASSYETDFGYPSGYFRIERATETEVNAREWVAKGSHFTQILGGFYRAILNIGAGLDVSAPTSCSASPRWRRRCCSMPLSTETLLKHLLRSQIQAALERSGGTKVTFTLPRPAALLVGRRLEQAFHSRPSRPGWPC